MLISKKSKSDETKVQRSNPLMKNEHHSLKHNKKEVIRTLKSKREPATDHHRDIIIKLIIMSKI